MHWDSRNELALVLQDFFISLSLRFLKEEEKVDIFHKHAIMPLQLTRPLWNEISECVYDDVDYLTIQYSLASSSPSWFWDCFFRAIQCESLPCDHLPITNELACGFRMTSKKIPLKYRKKRTRTGIRTHLHNASSSDFDLSPLHECLIEFSLLLA